MTIRINTAYPIFYSAIPMLAQKGIELNIVKSNSPFTLATINSPNIVIHPMSYIMKDEFPEIKFVGPQCKFPNYNYIPEVGYTDWNFEEIARADFVADIVFINTIGDMAFIKYLESLGKSLAIYGRPCDSLYYYGEPNVDSYALYKSAKLIAIDNEAELYKAARTEATSSHLLSNFNNNLCINFKDRKNDENIKDHFLTMKNKNWNEIFKNLFKELGINYGAN